MGIRFLCPNGHKLNVKSHLAGLKGVCPHCGAKFDIPLQSTLAPRRESPKGVAAAGSAPAPAKPAPAAQPGPAAAPKGITLPQSPARRETAPAPGAVAGQMPASPAAAAPAQPAAMAVASPTAAVPAGAAPMAAAAAPLATPVGVAPAAAPVGFQPVSPLAQPATPVGSVFSATVAPSPTAQSDPFGESPDVVWYVRPPSGGQFGPASPLVMRTWLQEGRITPDSLVWREGWRDWMEASVAFPQMTGDKLAALAGMLAGPALPGSPAVNIIKSRRRSKTLQVIGILLLLIALITLVSVFVYMLLGPPGEKPTASEPAAVTWTLPSAPASCPAVGDSGWLS